jgi:hypothetical protein
MPLPLPIGASTVVETLIELAAHACDIADENEERYQADADLLGGCNAASLACYRNACEVTAAEVFPDEGSVNVSAETLVAQRNFLRELLFTHRDFFRRQTHD